MELDGEGGDRHPAQTLMHCSRCHAYLPDPRALAEHRKTHHGHRSRVNWGAMPPGATLADEINRQINTLIQDRLDQMMFDALVNEVEQQ